MKMSLPKIFTRKSFILLVAFLLVTSLFLPKIIEAMYIPHPGGGPTEDLDYYKQALEDKDLNLDQYALYTFEKTLRAVRKFVDGQPVLESEKLAGTTGGAIGATGNLIVGLYVPPVSSANYLADLGQNLGLAPPVYAQGLGFNALRPILELWKAMRNIAYLFFVIIFVAIGFMIMFRKKIDPQTVASIQNALPQIIVALILVTFSYAIAGLLIDISELGIGLVAFSLSEFSAHEGPAFFDWLKELRGGYNIFQLMWFLYRTDIFVPAIENVVSQVAAGFGELLNVLHITSLLASVILGVAILTAMFKTFFMLLGAYVAIVLSTIFAPFIFLIGALPGRAGAVAGWVRNFLGNVLVFPATFALLFMGAILLGIERTPWEAVETAVSDTAAPWIPFGFGGFPPEDLQIILRQLLALGIILTTPKVGEAIKQALEIKPVPWGAEAGEAFRRAIARIPVIGGFMAG